MHWGLLRNGSGGFLRSDPLEILSVYRFFKRAVRGMHVVLTSET